MSLSYIICTTHRTGSSHLCSGLSSLNIAGNPDEWLLPGMFEKRKWTESHENVLRFIEAVKSEKIGTNEVFGIKLMWFNFNWLTNHLSSLPKYQGLSKKQIIENVFPNTRWIHLKRENQVAQAVSLTRAQQTNIYGIDKKDLKNSNADTPPTSFDYFHIRKNDLVIKQDQNSWESFFKESAIQPLRITYEEVADNLEDVVLRILDYCHLPQPPSTKQITSSHTKMADQMSLDWEKRYRKLKQWNQRIPFFDFFYKRLNRQAPK